MLQSLQLALGAIGRSDAITDSIGMLSWPAVKLVCQVRPCLFGCPEHPAKMSDSMARSVRELRRSYERKNAAYSELGWTILSLWECEVQGASAERVAHEIARYHSELNAKEEIVDPLPLAIWTEGKARYGENSWRAFLESMSVMPGTFRRSDLGIQLRRRGIHPLEARKLCTAGRYHRILRWSRNGLHPGPMLLGMLRVAGMKQGELHVEQRLRSEAISAGKRSALERRRRRIRAMQGLNSVVQDSSRNARDVS